MGTISDQLNTLIDDILNDTTGVLVYDLSNKDYISNTEDPDKTLGNFVRNIEDKYGNYDTRVVYVSEEDFNAIVATPTMDSSKLSPVMVISAPFTQTYIITYLFINNRNNIESDIMFVHIKRHKPTESIGKKMFL